MQAATTSELLSFSLLRYNLVYGNNTHIDYSDRFDEIRCEMSTDKLIKICWDGKSNQFDFLLWHSKFKLWLDFPIEFLLLLLLQIYRIPLLFSFCLLLSLVHFERSNIDALMNGQLSV